AVRDALQALSHADHPRRRGGQQEALRGAGAARRWQRADGLQRAGERALGLVTAGPRFPAAVVPAHLQPPTVPGLRARNR
nr:hypothetical protein [Tanacetum cinerariifolium]